MKEEIGALISIGRRTKGEVLNISHRREVTVIADRYSVESMTFSGLFYEWSVAELSDAESRISSCICEYFVRQHRLCKHMLMAVRKFPKTLVLPFNNNFHARSVLAVAAIADT